MIMGKGNRWDRGRDRKDALSAREREKDEDVRKVLELQLLLPAPKYVMA